MNDQINVNVDLRGHFAQRLQWVETEGGSGYWKEVEAKDTRHATFKGAVTEARAWAKEIGADSRV